ncbi:hypothetical protein EON65_57865 [archaeon]|nr:MAG: hypothetical protein EON65_57865 [archaeon]
MIIKHKLLVLLEQKGLFYTFALALSQTNKDRAESPLAGTIGILKIFYSFLLGIQLKVLLCKNTQTLSRIIHSIMKREKQQTRGHENSWSILVRFVAACPLFIRIGHY